VGVEIERKFLVRNEGWRAAASPPVPIRQGYLSRQPGRTVRVRLAGDEAFLTIKGPGSLERAEFEYPISPDDALALIELCEPGVVDKDRYRVPAGPLVWEVDVFGGDHEGLVLAEVELPSADTPVDLPAWVGQEVTGDDRYTNAVLSRPPS
jgi:CYTH domain-containing protein